MSSRRPKREPASMRGDVCWVGAEMELKKDLCSWSSYKTARWSEQLSIQWRRPKKINKSLWFSLTNDLRQPHWYCIMMLPTHTSSVVRLTALVWTELLSRSFKWLCLFKVHMLCQSQSADCVSWHKRSCWLVLLSCRSAVPEIQFWLLWSKIIIMKK